MAGISVAEKRALLEAAGEPWPVCDCHGEPMYWRAANDRILGGRWRCPAKARAYRTAYRRARGVNPRIKLSNEELLARKRERLRLWKLANPGRSYGYDPERARAYYLTNKAEIRATQQKYRAENREKVRSIEREYYRRRAGWYDEGGMATVPAKARSLA